MESILTLGESFLNIIRLKKGNISTLLSPHHVKKQGTNKHTTTFQIH